MTFEETDETSGLWIENHTGYDIIQRMMYVFVQLLAFTAKTRRLGLTLEDLRGIENEISGDPTGWPVMKGTGGLRKMRFAPERQRGGKSGGLRVCYFVMDSASHVYLVTLFAKNEQDNLTKAECAAIARLIGQIKALHRK